MSQSALFPGGFLLARLFALTPYVLAAAWGGMAPTQALMLGCLLELAFPQGTDPMRLAVRHLTCWGTMLFLQPDPFAWWMAPLWVLLIAGTHAWWVGRPRVAGLFMALLLLPAIADVVQRTDPAAAVASAGARNPWVAQVDAQDFGKRIRHHGVSLVLPSRAEPMPLEGSWRAQSRGAGLLCIALGLGLYLSRRRKLIYLVVGLAPLGLAYALLRPPMTQNLWLMPVDGGWQVLTIAWPELSFSVREPLPQEIRPSAAIATVERGPLLAPRQTGDEGILPLLLHWADAIADPKGSFEPELGQAPAILRWEIDSHGLLVLKALL
ncbi:MAG: hypothetical protein O3A50_01690 [Planctomycetota bacterium]|nr:hypothetical protein [Planctomycetota bacterium]